MHDERNDVAAFAAAPAVPHLLFAIDAEPIAPGADGARASQLHVAHALEMGAEAFGCCYNVDVASSRNEVGVDHCALSKAGARSRFTRLAEITRSAIIAWLRRTSPFRS